MADGALSDLRVLDFTHYIVGPYGTKLLADYGADVIKIERPGTGDPARSLGPFPDDKPDIEKSGLFFYLNTNKRSVALDLKSAAGREAALALARDADVVVESFRPGVMASLGLGYDDLRAVNPDVLLVSVSNFGQDGPCRDWRATPLVLFGMGGEMYSLGQPDRPPINQYPMATLVQSGAAVALAALAGVTNARETGEPDWADVSIFETQLGSQDRRIPSLVAYTFSGLVSQRVGNQSLGYPVGVYPCADGYVELTGAAHWDHVVHMLGDPPALLDPKWKRPDAPISVELKTEFEEILYPWLLERTKLEVWRAAQEARVLCGPLFTIEDLFNDENFRERGLWTEVAHPVLGTVQMPGRPFLMDDGWWLRRPAPLLGEHTGDVMAEAGWDRARIAEVVR